MAPDCWVNCFTSSDFWCVGLPLSYGPFWSRRSPSRSWPNGSKTMTPVAEEVMQRIVRWKKDYQIPLYRLATGVRAVAAEAGIVSLPNNA